MSKDMDENVTQADRDDLRRRLESLDYGYAAHVGLVARALRAEEERDEARKQRDRYKSILKTIVVDFSELEVLRDQIARAIEGGDDE